MAARFEGADKSGSEVPARAAVAAAVAELASFAANFRLDQLTSPQRDALDLVLIDTLGVIVAGASTHEFEVLAAALAGAGTGRTRTPGTSLRSPVDIAAFLMGTASCLLELDEGNKYARGHPAAHAVPAAMALAGSEELTIGELFEAVLVGHEVAARFGRAVRLREGFHPHGNWGVAGSAAAAGKVLGCGAGAMAGAIDAGAGLALAAPFDAALEGSFVRNTWIGQSAVSGIQAARLARAGLASNDGTAATTFGRLIGALDVESLTQELGARFDISLGYLKLHASCSFTHPPIDAALSIRADAAFDADRVVDVVVRTHQLAVPLSRTDPATRLAAMFSIPHLVAVALRTGRIDVEASGDEMRSDASVLALAQRVRLVHEPDFNRRAPAERPADVMVTLDDGRVLACSVPNPVGDADHHPLDRAAVMSKLTALIGGGAVERITAAVDVVRTDPDRPARRFLDALP